MPELFDWKKWFSGMVDLTRWAKDFGTLIRLVGILILVFLIIAGGVGIWKRIMPKQPQKTTIGECTGNSKVDASTDKKMKWGLINLW